MADYFTQVVVQPTIPYGDMTPLERLILPLVYDSDTEKDGIYFYSETGPADSIMLDREVLEKALEASARDSSLCDTIAKQFAAHAAGRRHHRTRPQWRLHRFRLSRHRPPLGDLEICHHRRRLHMLKNAFRWIRRRRDSHHRRRDPRQIHDRHSRGLPLGDRTGSARRSPYSKHGRTPCVAHDKTTSKNLFRTPEYGDIAWRPVRNACGSPGATPSAGFRKTTPSISCSNVGRRRAGIPC